jgi:hypothetical protein
LESSLAVVTPAGGDLVPTSRTELPDQDIVAQVDPEDLLEPILDGKAGHRREHLDLPVQVAGCRSAELR